MKLKIPQMNEKEGRKDEILEVQNKKAEEEERKAT